MIALQFRQSNVYCFHLYFMKTGHELNCCVFISRECSTCIVVLMNNEAIIYCMAFYYQTMRCHPTSSTSHFVDEMGVDEMAVDEM